jgi:hypothetical protein
MGMDVSSIVKYGVDMINASVSYYTDQENELEYIVSQAGGKAKVYYEMAHDVFDAEGISDTGKFMRPTDEMLYSTADLAYRKGADGVSFFNFAYFRENGSASGGTFGPFCEPPFYIFADIGNKEAAAAKSSHYFITPGWTPKYYWQTVKESGVLDKFKQMPKAVSSNGQISFTINTGRQRTTGQARMRIIAKEDISALGISAKVNGIVVPPGSNEKLYDYPTNRQMNGMVPDPNNHPEQCKGFVPTTANVFHAGDNTVTLDISGISGTVNFVMLEVYFSE